VYSAGVSVAMGAVMPILFELMRHSPRLACLGMLGAWLAPILFAAAGHRVAHGILDAGDSRRARTTPSGSLWAGFVAWAAIIFVTLTTSFVMLVLDPPPVDPDAIWNLAAEVTRGVSGAAHAAVWIVIAAYVYQLERLGRRTAAEA